MANSTRAVAPGPSGMDAKTFTSDLHGTIQIVEPGSSDHLYEFLSTLAWIALIVGLVLFFHKQIRRLLDTITMRLDKGAPFEMGPVKVGAVAAQTADQQAAKLDSEARQTVAEASEAAVPHNLARAPGNETLEAIKSIYVFAEDLAMREIQAEFQVPISRNVMVAPSGQEFDGHFKIGQVGYFVEAKLFQHIALPKTVSRIVEQFSASIREIKTNGWWVPRGILVIVYRTDVDLSAEGAKFSNAFSTAAVKVDVRVYLLSELLRKYGVVVPET